MSSIPFGAIIAVAVHVLVEALLIVRVLTRPHRQPASRIAWIVVIAALPVIGIVAYLLFGETNIGRRRTAKLRAVIAGMPAFPARSPGTRKTCGPTCRSDTNTCSGSASRSAVSSRSAGTPRN